MGDEKDASKVRPTAVDILVIEMPEPMPPDGKRVSKN